MMHLKIVQIAAELAPLAKVGGLGDVIYGLTRALQEKKAQVEVILPKYNCLDLSEVTNLHILQHDFTSFFNGQWHHNTVWKGVAHGIEIILIEPHDPWGFFERGKVYGCPDDVDRFLYFCRAAVDYLYTRNQLPDILHVHDWHLSAIPLLLRHLKETSPKVVLTIHNHTYQGITPPESLYKAGLSKTQFPYRDTYNLLEEGIRHADYVTTVSPTYAQEILSPEGGGALYPVLQKVAQKGTFEGILNGIDQEYWNPQHDPFLPYHYSPDHRSAKAQVQHYVRKIFSLEENHAPLVSSITRLVYQKSPELIKAALRWTLKNQGQFILLASSADSATHEEFYALKRELAENASCHIELSFDERLSHLVYAASDILLVPSRFEPCGLTQLYAMRYGALPLVRKTGGLADTVFEDKNGFTFVPLTTEAQAAALERAFQTYRQNPQQWEELQQEGMKTDFSWKKPLERYLAIYHQLAFSPLPQR